MASRGDQVIDAVIARLRIPEDLSELSQELQDLAAELEGLEVDRYPLREGKGLRVRVYPFKERVTAVSRSVVSRAILVKLEVVTVLDDEQAADQATDGLFVWCVRRLIPDQQLGGIATGIKELERAWGAGEGQRPHAKQLLDIEVTYQTLADNPEARA